ncbi:hypothetical protein DPMN_028336 [Dreissena polymorpha]|uniref:Uncharacterized protein n=1 Tax=Dreissena polymorpha TaxID=45954 RepID=A0A9D4LUJ5_DREPO|nr:hypothetical protein DPMN_028336 [Dreissena polymorpha]
MHCDELARLWTEYLAGWRDAYRKSGRLTTARTCRAATSIITGSKAEGLTFSLESDRDVMIALSSVICIEYGVNADNFHKEITVFRLDSRMSYPGHCGLLLERRGTKIDPHLNDAFCDDGYGRKLLNSDLYVNK